MLHKSAAVTHNSYQTCESDGELPAFAAEQQEAMSLSPKQEVEVHFHSTAVTLSALIVALRNKEARRAPQTDCTQAGFIRSQTRERLAE